MSATVELPTTLDAAHALIADLHSKNVELLGDIERLEHQIEQFLRHRFGQRSEKIDPAQYKIAFLELEAKQPSGENDAGEDVEIQVRGHVRRTKEGHGRVRFAKDLPRVRNEIAPESTKCPGCEQEMTRIGAETSEQVDYRPATVRVIETVRPKFACPKCKEGVSCAPPPFSPVPRSRATAATLAHVAVSKYVDHLPLARQSSMLARQGVHVSKQTLCGWVRQISDLLGPVERAQWESVVSSDVLMADETTVNLQQPERCKTAWLWGYLGDRDEVVFGFSTSREAKVPVAALKGFRRGTLVCDAYAGYNEFLRSRSEVERGGCWAHARREFFEAQGNDKMRALRVLSLIAQLYDVEREAAGLAEGWCRSRAERSAVVLGVRRMKSVHVLQVLKAALERMRDQVLPKSPIGKAIAYVLSQWEDLERFTGDGAIPIDNNALEREMRTIAVGRRNWTFCGSEDGGAWAARLYGLLGTCRLQGVNPYEWLHDVLTRVRHHPRDRMAELTPRQWAAARRAQATPASADTS